MLRMVMQIALYIRVSNCARWRNEIEKYYCASSLVPVSGELSCTYDDEGHTESRHKLAEEDEFEADRGQEFDAVASKEEPA